MGLLRLAGYPFGVVGGLLCAARAAPDFYTRPYSSPHTDFSAYSDPTSHPDRYPHSAAGIEHSLA